MSNITYCKRWVRKEKRAAEVIDESKAKEAHEKGDPYVALLGDEKKPDMVVSVNLGTGFVGSAFLDEHQRIKLEYTFKEVEKGKLFLTESFRFVYKGDSNDVMGTEKFQFQPDGKVTITRKNLETNEVETKESREKIDLEMNWDKVPEFGHYDSLLRKER